MYKIDVETNITEKCKHIRMTDRRREKKCYIVVLDFGCTDCAHHKIQKASYAKWVEGTVCRATVCDGRAQNAQKYQRLSKKRHIKTSISDSLVMLYWLIQNHFVWMAVAQTSMWLLLSITSFSVFTWVYECVSGCICLCVTIKQIKAPNKTKQRTTRFDSTSMKSNISCWSCNKKGATTRKREKSGKKHQARKLQENWQWELCIQFYLAFISHTIYTNFEAC